MQEKEKTERKTAKMVKRAHALPSMLPAVLISLCAAVQVYARCLLLKIQRRQPTFGLIDVVEVCGRVGLTDERKGPLVPITASRLGAGEEPKEAQGPRRVGGGEGVVHAVHHDRDPQAVVVREAAREIPALGD